MNELKQKVIEILKQHNIRMMVHGCGCCGSPSVSFEKDGVLIVDNVDYFYFNMLQEDKIKDIKG